MTILVSAVALGEKLNPLLYKSTSIIGSMECERCNGNHDGSYGSGRFCSMKCAKGHSTSRDREEINRKVRQSLKNRGYAGKPITKEHRLKMQTAQAAMYASLPFDGLCTMTKRKRVINEQERKCNRCGINEWLGQPITLELEHIDGNRDNGNRDNLEAICPNCHSLTTTWRGRNVARKNKVRDEQLTDALANHDTISAALRSLGLAPKGNHYKRAHRLMSASGGTRTHDGDTASPD